MSRIVVGMSGGVDSSVVAYLLKSQGHDVVGVFMKNWDDMTSAPAYRAKMDSDCTWEKDAADARAVCERLGIPFKIYHLEKEYYDRVFQGFLADLHAGLTPNPDILCNQEMKFDVFLRKAMQEEDADHIATGHYARIVDGALCRPKDRQKDQTYFLARMPREALRYTLFPLGEYTKAEVRAIAQREGFENARKKDSTGICFIGDIDYRTFIRQYMSEAPGRIISVDGEVLGQHSGLFQFTLGQRNGLGIGGNGPYYVVEKKADTRELVVTNQSDDSRLFQDRFFVQQVYWLSERRSPHGQYDVAVRYRQQAAPAQLIVHDAQETVEIVYTESQRAVTPGQYAVWYHGDEVIGSGKIVPNV